MSLPKKLKEWNDKQKSSVLELSYIISVIAKGIHNGTLNLDYRISFDYKSYFVYYHVVRQAEG